MKSNNAPAEPEMPLAAARRNPATLYDAVAGRVNYEAFQSEQQTSRNRDTASTSLAAVPPEEVLFRRRGAPLRFAEDDVYEADRHLKPDQKLPDSDLLKAIHAYAADYYSRASQAPSEPDTRSMDETALLAFGILLEEASAEVLGKTGDLAYVEEPDEHGSNRVRRAYWQNGQPRESVLSRTQPRHR